MFSLGQQNGTQHGQNYYPQEDIDQLPSSDSLNYGMSSPTPSHVQRVGGAQEGPCSSNLSEQRCLPRVQETRMHCYSSKKLKIVAESLPKAHIPSIRVLSLRSLLLHSHNITIFVEVILGMLMEYDCDQSPNYVCFISSFSLRTRDMITLFVRSRYVSWDIQVRRLQRNSIQVL